jgi:hypothetical protein
VNPQDDASRVVVEHAIEALKEFEKTKLKDILGGNPKKNG